MFLKPILDPASRSSMSQGFALTWKSLLRILGQATRLVASWAGSRGLTRTEMALCPAIPAPRSHAMTPKNCFSSGMLLALMIGTTVSAEDVTMTLRRVQSPQDYQWQFVIDPAVGLLAPVRPLIAKPAPVTSAFTGT